MFVCRDLLLINLWYIVYGRGEVLGLEGMDVNL